MRLEQLRNEISRFLIDTSEQSPLKCNISIGSSYGISELERPVVTDIFQIPGEGIIYFTIEGYFKPIEFDDLDEEDLEIILKYLYEKN